MGITMSKVLAAFASIGLSSGVNLRGFDGGGVPRYGHTIPSRNGGKKSGAAAIKRAAAKRRNQRRK